MFPLLVQSVNKSVSSHGSTSDQLTAKHSFISYGSVFTPRDTNSNGTVSGGHHQPRRISSFSQALVTMAGYRWRPGSIYLGPGFLAFLSVSVTSILASSPFTTHTPYDMMLRSKFSASVESFLSSSSSSSSVSEHCGCPECEQIHPTPRRTFFRRSFPSPSKLHIPATPLVWVVYSSHRSNGLTLQDSITTYLHQLLSRCNRRSYSPWGIARFSPLGISQSQ